MGYRQIVCQISDEPILGGRLSTQYKDYAAAAVALVQRVGVPIASLLRSLAEGGARSMRPEQVLRRANSLDPSGHVAKVVSLEGDMLVFVSGEVTVRVRMSRLGRPFGAALLAAEVMAA